ncbi:DUF1648 domain-containing protein [Niallia taxi]|uniref:DUF1648 domain-containing protein n=1 Tax=Niallia taxi TaxID=2499688 RepID=UPI003D2BC438
MFNRRDNIQKSSIEKFLNLISWILLITTFLYLSFKWSSIPNSIPMRFDSNGIITHYGNKISILGLPIFGLLVLMVFGLLELFPKNINLKIYNSNDKEKELKYNRMFINVVKNGIVVVLVCANWLIISKVL